MKLRKKARYEIDTYFKMFELRWSSLGVLKILQDSYKREEVKKR